MAVYFNVTHWSCASQSNWWLRLDLNQRPSAYESGALPLSYAAKSKDYNAQAIQESRDVFEDDYSKNAQTAPFGTACVGSGCRIRTGLREIMSLSGFYTPHPRRTWQV